MLEATSYRYEVMQQKSRTKASIKKQQDRLKEKEEKYDKLTEMLNKQLTTEKKISQRAEWDESLEIKSESKRLQKNLKVSKGEMKLAGDCLVEVRRAALKNLFEKEMEGYKQELNAMGKTFYSQRV